MTGPPLPSCQAMDPSSALGPGALEHYIALCQQRPGLALSPVPQVNALSHQAQPKSSSACPVVTKLPYVSRRESQSAGLSAKHYGRPLHLDGFVLN